MLLQLELRATIRRHPRVTLQSSFHFTLNFVDVLPADFPLHRECRNADRIDEARALLGIQNRVLIWNVIWRPAASAVPENSPLKLITFN